MKLFNTTSYPYRDFGLLILRVGIGIMFMLHGQPKLFGGVEKWRSLGRTMSNLGIDFMPEFWGFMAGFAEFGGGLLLLLGVFFVPACFLLFFTMMVATVHHLASGDGVMGASHAIEAGILFFSLMFIGPGKYRIDRLWR